MKRILFSLLIFALAGISSSEAPKPPFPLSIVPEYSSEFGASISMDRQTPKEFYVVLTNISQQPQAVYETWNGWGYHTISFELATSEGRKYVISKRPRDFDKNFPSTYLIKPGEAQVYPIQLDDTWETTPLLPMQKEMQITIKAIYEVSPSRLPRTMVRESFKVWAGRVESHSYDFKFFSGNSR